jgi:hypothetical protein
MIYNLKRMTQNLKNSQQNTSLQQHKIGIPFTYYKSSVQKVTNIFKNTNLHITFHTTNMLFDLVCPQTEHPNNYTKSGIYKLTCNTCNKVYAQQSGRQINTRFNEHIPYIRYNSKSARTQHNLNNKHEYRNIQVTSQLVKACTKGKDMTCWENYFIQLYQQHGLFVSEQTVNESNPLFHLIINKYTK